MKSRADFNRVMSSDTPARVCGEVRPCGEEFTGVHTDRVFLGKGTHRLVTAWLPFGEVRVDDGALMVARCSHRSETFAHLRATYGTSTVGGDGTRSGWVTDDAAALPAMLLRRGVGDKKTRGGGGGGGDDADIDGDDDGAAGECDDGDGSGGDGGGGGVPEVDWRTAHFQPGDVAVLTIDTVHMSAANCSAGSGGGAAGGAGASGASVGASGAAGAAAGAAARAARVRVSCDTRWQPACEPTDPRLKVWRRRASGGGGVLDQLRLDGREVVPPSP